MPCSKGVVNIHVKLDPTSEFVQKKGWLPDDVDTPIAMYLSLYHVYHQEDKKDSLEDVKRELGQLGLSDHDMKYAMFRTETYTKYLCRSLLTPRTMIQTGRLHHPFPFLSCLPLHVPY